MKIITITTNKSFKIPLEFDNILPEILFDKDFDDISNLIVYQGNKEFKLKDFFDIEVSGECSSPQDCKLIINGQLNRIKYIGTSMSEGIIVANGDVDLQAGSLMSGGHLIINGDAESYIGREMTGGLIEVKGNVKEFCGSSYAGEWRGMNGGKIIIEGNVGKQLADCMLNGFIHVKGNCDILPGVHMAGGLIQIDGNVSKWPGGQMKKGVIIVNGNVEEVLPGFYSKEIIHNPKINGSYYIGKYKLYIGDKSSNGKGSLWLKIN